MTPDDQPTSPSSPRDLIDPEEMWATFAALAAVDTSVKPGEVTVPADDPRLLSFATDLIGPALTALGASLQIDPMNNLIATFGPRSGRELLVTCYPALHHGNEMPEPLRARRVRQPDGESWVALGAGQGKGAMAALLTALGLLHRRHVDLSGRLIVAVSTEGSSSNASAASLHAALDPLPAAGLLIIGTGNRIALGHRGRVDIRVVAEGQATHSSAADRGRNPIPVITLAQQRLAATVLDPAHHPDLGPRVLVPYRLTCHPIAPHTIPSRCELVLDRRFLPDEDPDTIVADIARLLADLPVEVEAGPTMLPAAVPADSPLVTRLQAAAQDTLGRSLPTFHPAYTFDAGYGCHVGVPTVMLGPSTENLDTTGVLGIDAVPRSMLIDAAAVYAATIDHWT